MSLSVDFSPPWLDLLSFPHFRFLFELRTRQMMPIKKIGPCRMEVFHSCDGKRSRKWAVASPSGRSEAWDLGGDDFARFET
jgi:hypothetical protein